MINRHNIKYYLLTAFIIILMYKFIDDPGVFLSMIINLCNFLSPFLIAIFIVLIINPIIVLIETKLKLSRLFSLIIVYLTISSLLIFILNMIVPTLINMLNNLTKDMPLYIDSFSKLINSFSNLDNPLSALTPKIGEIINSYVDKLAYSLNNIDTNLFSILPKVTSSVFNFFIGVVLSIYILLDLDKIIINIRKLLYSSLPYNKVRKYTNFIKKSNKIFYCYISGQLIISVIIGILAFLGFKFILRLDNSLFLSIVILTTNLIPFFGPFIGAIPAVVMTLISSPMKTLWVILFIFILQQIEGNFICPKVMSQQTGLSPLWVISSVLIGGELLGFLGVFISVPTAAVIKMFIDDFVTKKYISR